MRKEQQKRAKQQAKAEAERRQSEQRKRNEQKRQDEARQQEERKRQEERRKKEKEEELKREQEAEEPNDHYTNLTLKELYRLAAKSTHPDIGLDEYERVVRTKVMVQINIAYEKKDKETLIRILRANESILR